jgi:uncharacterized BrkB/YihY/UPF0761 family membrane protein
MDKTFIGLVIFVAALLVSRVISEKALRKLKEDEAARLVQGFSGFRTYNLVAILALVAVFFAISYSYPQHSFRVAQVFMGILVAFLLVTGVISFRKLKFLRMPDAYLNSYLLATFVQYAGIFIYFGFSLSRYS